MDGYGRIESSANMRYSESLLRARQEDTLAALDTLEAGDTTTDLGDAHADRLARRQSRLLDALRSLCEQHGVVVDVSPAALSSGVSTCTKAPVDPTSTGASTSLRARKERSWAAAHPPERPCQPTYPAHDS